MSNFGRFMLMCLVEVSSVHTPILWLSLLYKWSVRCTNSNQKAERKKKKDTPALHTHTKNLILPFPMKNTRQNKGVTFFSLSFIVLALRAAELSEVCLQNKRNIHCKYLAKSSVLSLLLLYKWRIYCINSNKKEERKKKKKKAPPSPPPYLTPTKNPCQNKGRTLFSLSFLYCAGAKHRKTARRLFTKYQEHPLLVSIWPNHRYLFQTKWQVLGLRSRWVEPETRTVSKIRCTKSVTNASQKFFLHSALWAKSSHKIIIGLLAYPNAFGPYCGDSCTCTIACNKKWTIWWFFVCF